MSYILQQFTRCPCWMVQQEMKAMVLLQLFATQQLRQHFWKLIFRGALPLNMAPSFPHILSSLLLKFIFILLSSSRASKVVHDIYQNTIKTMKQYWVEIKGAKPTEPGDKNNSFSCHKIMIWKFIVCSRGGELQTQAHEASLSGPQSSCWPCSVLWMCLPGWNVSLDSANASCLLNGGLERGSVQASALYKGNHYICHSTNFHLCLPIPGMWLPEGNVVLRLKKCPILAGHQKQDRERVKSCLPREGI